MKVLFLDIDGVLNSHQSAHFWHNHRDQKKWNEELAHWEGTLREYIAQEFCPIAVSNLEELMRRVPDLQICISSTWRYGETVETLQQLFKPFPLISKAVMGFTPRSPDRFRGKEIQAWLDEAHRTSGPKLIEYCILDDDGDMLPEQYPRFVQTNALEGFMFKDMQRVEKLFKA